MYSLQHLSKIINGTLLSNFSKFLITELAIDSRQISTPTNALFVALVTSKNDGHLFIKDAYKKGVRNFLLSSTNSFLAGKKDCSILHVTNTQQALQDIASYHRKQFKLPIIGITGSHGKTIVKEWLFQLLSPDYTIVRSPKSYNSQIGVPLSVWQLNKNHTLGIIEAGISQPNEMEQLQKIIQPTIGIITNIGDPHNENFNTHQQKALEKIKLFTKVDTLIYSLDQIDISTAVKSLQLKKQFTWSRTKQADLHIIDQITNEYSTHLTAIFKKKKITVQIPFVDDASIENAIHCWACLLFLKTPAITIAKRLLTLHAINMRLELNQGINQCIIVNDSYSADLDSLRIALHFLKQQKNKKNTVILSDFIETGIPEKELYQSISQLLKQHRINNFIGIGKSISTYKKLFTDSIFYNTTSDFLNDIKLNQFFQTNILIKGARVFQFEKINEYLQQKTHETTLEINLNALVQNLNYYRSKLPRQTKIMAMVKAFSYGSGCEEIASILQYHKVDYLTVAYTDEGVQLRKGGITLPIMVMNPENHTFKNIFDFNLEPEIYNFKTLELLEQAAIQYHQTKRKINIHLKFDTGMHRLGFDKKDLPKILTFLKDKPYLKIKSIFSHLAASDENKHDAFTKKQINEIQAIANQLKKQLPYTFLTHISNSSGISRFANAHFDMVRLGIGLYGVSNIIEEQPLLENVSTLRTTISQIKTISPPETIGYSRNGKLSKTTTIAVIPIGYADGLSRQLSNKKGYVMINKKLAPIIGNVCMDMCMVDITGIKAEEGAEVIIFGKDYPISNIALQANTIPYEILTGISQRVKRIYYYD